MLKSLQARLQQYMNRELLDIQAGFRNGRGTRDQIANMGWIIKKQDSSSLGCMMNLSDFALVEGRTDSSQSCANNYIAMKVQFSL